VASQVTGLDNHVSTNILFEALQVDIKNQCCYQLCVECG
jgi:hypothetical protein